MRLLFAILLILTLSACKCEPTIKTIHDDKYVPILYVPEPPKVIVPEYYANTLTEEQKNDIGELTKAYVISSQEQKNYIKNLETVYNLYVDLAEKSKKQLEALENLGEVDRSLLEQANVEIQSTLKSLSEEMEYNNSQHNSQMLQSISQMHE
jgi:hypothetical protein